jgi:ribonuclease J
MVSLRFYGGVGEIGGNKILLEDGDTKIWLDFGQSFTMGCDYYVGWLQPRSSSILADLFEFNLLPKIAGLYDEELLEGTEIEGEPPDFDGVLISHAHADHVNHIEFLHPDLPVHAGAGTKLFMEAMEKTSGFVNYGEHDYRCFRTGDRLRIGSLDVEPVHVDHSIPSAYGHIIHTSEGAVAYTGDLRAHGPRADMTEEFLEKAADAKPIALITEGTRMAASDRRKNLSEAEVLTGVKGICEEADRDGKMVLFTQGPRDMDRLRTFYSAARDCGRRVVVNPKTAHLLLRLVEDEHLDLPDPTTDEGLAVYFRRKRSGEYLEKDYYVWEREFLDRRISVEELKERPQDHIFNLGFTHFAELVDIRPEAGTPFIYSMSEPFGEEDLEARVMHNWLEHFDLRYHQLHASGHMSREELVDAIARINPKKVFPVHTEHPEMFHKYLTGTVQPAMGETYHL